MTDLVTVDTTEKKSSTNKWNEKDGGRKEGEGEREEGEASLNQVR